MNCERGKNPHANLPKTKLRVEVIAEKDGHGGIRYRQEMDGRGGKIDLPRDSGPYKIIFDLDDFTDLGLRFDAAAPFYCEQTNGNCPTSGLDREQIMVESCDGDELVVVDWNYGESMELHYQLNFTDRYGNPQEPFDPVIVNGGGTKTFT